MLKKHCCVYNIAYFVTESLVPIAGLGRLADFSSSESLADCWIAVLTHLLTLPAEVSHWFDNIWKEGSLSPVKVE